MTEKHKTYHIGQCVRYRPYSLIDKWEEEEWWIVEKVTTECWSRPATVAYRVARVSDPTAAWRVDTADAEQLAGADAPAGFHVPPHSA